MASRVTRSRRQPPAQQQQADQCRAKWTNALTTVLVELMVEEARKGNRLKNSFTKKAWRYIGDEFHKRTGFRWDKEQLKNRFSVLRKQYIVVKGLLEHMDFTWDESQGGVVARDEAWDAYIKEHPDAEVIKASGCPFHSQLCIVFSESASHNGKHDNSDDLDSEIPYLEPLNSAHLPESSSESEEVDDMEFDPTLDSVHPTTPTTTGIRKRGRKGVDDAIAGAIAEMASASKLRTAAMKQLSSKYSISDCIKELDLLPDVEDHVYFAALELFSHRNARETFLSLKNDKRAAWLQWKCNAVSNTLIPSLSEER